MGVVVSQWASKPSASAAVWYLLCAYVYKLITFAVFVKTLIVHIAVLLIVAVNAAFKKHMENAAYNAVSLFLVAQCMIA